MRSWTKRKRELKAASKLKAIGCIVGYSYEWSDRRNRVSWTARFIPPSIDKVLPLALVSRIRLLIIDCFNNDESKLQPIQDLIDLQDIGIVDSNIDERTLSWLSKLNNLKYLSLHGSSVTDENVCVLSGMSSLKTLVLTNTMVSRKTIQHLSGILSSCDIIFESSD